MKAADRLRIPRKDLRRDVFRSGGPGGQHQNKTESGVRWTHVPSGISAESRDDRSQHANSEIAYERLCEKLLRAYLLARGRRERLPPATFGAARRSYRLVGKDQGVEDTELGVYVPRPALVLGGGIDPFLRAALEKTLRESTLWLGES